MRYIKTYESKVKLSKRDEDIEYLVKIQGTGYVKYIIQVIDFYKMTDEQIHNLKIAVEYRYLPQEDFKNVVSEIINFNKVWHSTSSERAFKIAYEKDFRKKIIRIKKPYPICYKTWNRYPFEINKKYFDHETDSYINKFFYDNLETGDFNDVIGEIPPEYPFDKRYLVGEGRFRGSTGTDKTLWEEFKGKKRESDFIRVFEEKDIHILTEDEIDIIKMRGNAEKYNL